MIPLIVISAIVAVPILLSLILRVNVVFVFLSICVGFFLQSVLSDDVDLVLATIIKGSDSMVAASLILLFLPVVITLFVMRKTQGKGFVFQVVPLIFSGLFLATLSLPLLPTVLEQQIYAGQFGNGIRQSGDLIIAAAAISNLVIVYTLFRSKPSHRKHH